MEVKRKCVDLSLSDKVKVINMLKKKNSQMDIAKKLGISQSQVSRVCKSQNEIMKQWKCNENPDRKRQRTGKAADVETALSVWFSNSRGRDVPLSGPVLQEKAQELAKKLNKPEFKANTVD
jgi:IS30 family transposase